MQPEELSLGKSTNVVDQVSLWSRANAIGDNQRLETLLRDERRYRFGLIMLARPAHAMFPET